MFSANTTAALDYAPCRYNSSRLWFRGPRRSLSRKYIACIGGCEVYGQFVKEPFADLLEMKLGRPVVNLGVSHAGPDAFLNDPGALLTVSAAQRVVLHLTSPANGSNRFYSVHPRRNDRFLKASDSLHELYPEMDFTEIHFVGHLLTRLHELDDTRFVLIRQELRAAWKARMRQLLGQLRGPVTLLWVAPQPLEKSVAKEAGGGHSFLDMELIEPFLKMVHGLEQVVPPDWDAGRNDMVFGDFDEARAAALPTPATHTLVAERLATKLI